jgi:N-acetylmuramoyl-L-alanine amidase-like protein
VVGNGLSRRGMLGGMLGAGLIVTVSAGAQAAAEPLVRRPLRQPLRQPSVRQPVVHTRREWRAKAPRRRARVLATRPDHIVVHHTATANTADVSLAHAFALSRQIQRFHMGSRRWDDIGEQLTISRGGHIMEGRNGSLRAIQSRRLVVGAQTLHHNGHTIGIENEGAYATARPPAALWSSLVEACAWLCAVYELDPITAIVGHRDYVATSCPGDVLYGMLPRLRSEAAAALGTAGSDAGTLADGTGEELWSDQDTVPAVPDPPEPPEYGVPQDGGPQDGGPQDGGPQDGGPQYGGPQYGGPQYGGPGGPGYGGPRNGARGTGSPDSGEQESMAGSQDSGPL